MPGGARRSGGCAAQLLGRSRRLRVERIVLPELLRVWSGRGVLRRRRAWGAGG
jgi:hypothetical protein